MNKLLIILLSFSLISLFSTNCMEKPEQTEIDSNSEISVEKSYINVMFDEIKARRLVKDYAKGIIGILKKILISKTCIDIEWASDQLKHFNHKQILKIYKKALKKYKESFDKKFEKILIKYFYLKLISIIGKAEVEIYRHPKANPAVKYLFSQNFHEILDKNVSPENTERIPNCDIITLSPNEILDLIFIPIINDLFKESYFGPQLDIIDYTLFRKAIGFINNVTLVNHKLLSLRKYYFMHLIKLFRNHVVLLRAYDEFLSSNRSWAPGKSKSLFYILICLNKIDANIIYWDTDYTEAMDALTMVIHSLVFESQRRGEKKLLLRIIDILLAQDAKPDNAFVYLIDNAQYQTSRSSIFPRIKKVISILVPYLSNKSKRYAIANANSDILEYLDKLGFKLEPEPEEYSEHFTFPSDSFCSLS